MRTCELLLAAISDTFLQILQLVFHLLVLSFRLLTLPPVGTNTKEADREMFEHINTQKNKRDCVRPYFFEPVAVDGHGDEEQHRHDNCRDDYSQRNVVFPGVVD